MRESFQDDSQQPDMFNESAARRERLAYRLGQERLTERALGIDEAEARSVQLEVEAARAEKEARQQKLIERLGETGSETVKPE